MEYEWDPDKAQANLDKHSIDFADATAIFSDDYLMIIDDPHRDEDRFVGIGVDSFFQILVVTFTWRGDTIRIISARRATKREQRQYESG